MWRAGNDRLHAMGRMSQAVAHDQAVTQGRHSPRDAIPAEQAGAMAQGRNSPREARPEEQTGATPAPIEQATKPGHRLRTGWLMTATAKNHGEVYGQQPLGLGDVRDQPFASWQIRSLYGIKQAQGHEQAKPEPGTRALLKDTL